MNCLDFHRHKLADPRRLSAAAQSHAHECRECCAFAQSVDTADARIERALNVTVPEGLAERVLLRHSRATRPAWGAWALAASVVLAAAVGFNPFGGIPPAELKSTPPAPSAQSTPPNASTSASPLEYARLAIEHVAEEPGSFTKLYNTEPGVFREAIRSVGAELREPIGRVRYVKLCPWGAKSGWHIVFETRQGLATLILVPNTQIDAAATATANGWSAIVQPAQSGYYAVVTGSAKATQFVDRLVTERIKWKS